jgi:2-hydroxycyclohexanecarboxyl-CoA dehydrogenase
MGCNAIPIRTDVTDWDSVQAMVKRTLEEFKVIDVLVNVVGWTIDRLFVEKPREEWEREIALNFWSTINCSRGVLDHMIKRKYGKIISIASDAGRVGEYKEAVYGGCKGAVIAMSKSIAKEVARYGINVNVICPGVTLPTNLDIEVGEGSSWGPHGFGRQVLLSMTEEQKQKLARAYPLGRVGKAEDVANMVIFLASDVASFMTGQTISISGGYTMC